MDIGAEDSKEGEATNNLFGILTTDPHPNSEVGAVHPKAMLVILTKREDIEMWMTARRNGAALQRPLPDGALKDGADCRQADRGDMKTKDECGERIRHLIDESAGCWRPGKRHDPRFDPFINSYGSCQRFFGLLAV